MKQKLLTTGFT